MQKKSFSERIVSLIDVDKRQSVMQAFISSHFSNCLLIWMFHDWGLKNKITWIHERWLRIVHGDNKSSFEELLRKYKSVKIHHRHLQVLATEIYNVQHGLSPQIMNSVFNLKIVPYNMRRQDLFRTRNVHSVHHDK